MSKKRLIFCIAYLFPFLFLSDGFAQDYARWHLPEGAIARFGKGEIKDVQFSPDGTRLAVSTPIGIWMNDARTGKEISLFTGYPMKPSDASVFAAMLPVQVSTALTFTADDTMVASAYGTILHVWDTQTGDTLATLEKHPALINAVAFAPDNMRLATGSSDWKIRLWDVPTGGFLSTFLGSPSAVNALAFSPDGQILASAGSTLRLWDVATGDTLFAGSDDLGSVALLEFSPDGKTLVSGGGWDTSAHLWDTATGTRRAILSGHTKDISDVAFSPDGKTLATAGKDDEVHVWQVDTGTPLMSLPPEIPALPVQGRGKAGRMRDVYTVAFSRDGKTLRCGSLDGSVHLWDLGTAQHLSTFALTEHFKWVQTLAFSGDGARLASSGWGEEARVWDVATGKQLEMITLPVATTSWADRIQEVTFAQDLTKFAVRSLSNKISVRRVATRIVISTLEIENAVFIWRLTFSPNGKMIAGKQRDKVLLWDVDTGELLWTETGERFAFAPDSGTLAIADKDRQIKLWALWALQENNVSPATAKNKPALIITLAGHTDAVEALAFSQEGWTLASGGGYEIRLWDRETGRALATLDTGIEDVSALAFSPDGKVLVSGSSHGTLQLWNVDTAAHFRSLATGYESSVSVLCFSPDGNLFASGSSDGTVLIWDKLD